MSAAPQGDEHQKAAASFVDAIVSLVAASLPIPAMETGEDPMDVGSPGGTDGNSFIPELWSPKTPLEEVDILDGPFFGDLGQPAGDVSEEYFLKVEQQAAEEKAAEHAAAVAAKQETAKAAVEGIVAYVSTALSLRHAAERARNEEAQRTAAEEAAAAELARLKHAAEAQRAAAEEAAAAERARNEEAQKARKAKKKPRKGTPAAGADAPPKVKRMKTGVSRTDLVRAALYEALKDGLQGVPCQEGVKITFLVDDDLRGRLLQQFDMLSGHADPPESATRFVAELRKQLKLRMENSASVYIKNLEWDTFNICLHKAGILRPNGVDARDLFMQTSWEVSIKDLYNGRDFSKGFFCNSSPVTLWI